MLFSAVKLFSLREKERGKEKYTRETKTEIKVAKEKDICIIEQSAYNKLSLLLTIQK
jgi:hypothetical protein